MVVGLKFFQVNDMGKLTLWRRAPCSTLLAQMAAQGAREMSPNRGNVYLLFGAPAAAHADKFGEEISAREPRAPHYASPCVAA